MATAVCRGGGGGGSCSCSNEGDAGIANDVRSTRPTPNPQGFIRGPTKVVFRLRLSVPMLMISTRGVAPPFVAVAISYEA